MNKKAFVATLCVAVLLVTLAAGCRGNRPMAPDGGGGDSPGVTTTTPAATTATIKDEPLATMTGAEMTGTTTTTVNASSLDKTETTTQGGSASATKGTASKPTKTQATMATSGKKDYLDISKLTGTQEDVGKVVGYSIGFKADITVVSVEERANADGRKSIVFVLSNGTAHSIAECRYCHEMPCPDGGDEHCSQYDLKKDSRITCQNCGRPYGDGYNGTCDSTIDWDNGGITICHHYD